MASCAAEAEQIVDLYGADPERVVSSRPASTTPSSAPGPRAAARRAVGLDPAGAGGALRRPDPAAEGARRRGRGVRPPAGDVPSGRRRGPERAGGSRLSRACIRQLAGRLGVDDRIRWVPPAAPRNAGLVLPGRRRRARAEPVRVVRPGRPGGGGVRDAGGRQPRSAGCAPSCVDGRDRVRAARGRRRPSPRPPAAILADPGPRRRARPPRRGARRTLHVGGRGAAVAGSLFSDLADRAPVALLLSPGGRPAGHARAARRRWPA